MESFMLFSQMRQLLRYVTLLPSMSVINSDTYSTTIVTYIGASDSLLTGSHCCPHL